jgi:WD40 repeat protein
MSSLDSYKKQITCEICNSIFENPVELQCKKFICQKHTVNEKNISCKLCQKFHVVPAAGFRVDEIQKQFVDSIKHVIIKNQLVEPISLLEKELESTLKEKNMIEERFNKILEQINCHKKVLLKQLNSEKKNLLDKVEMKNKVFSENRKRKLDENENGELVEIKKKTQMFKENLDANKIQEHQKDSINNIRQRQLMQVENINQQKYDLFIVCGCYDGKIHIWDLDKRKILKTLEGHSQQITSLDYFDKTFLASASFDKKIKVWNIKTGHMVKSIESSSTPRCLKRLSNKEMTCALENDKIKLLNFDGKDIDESLEFEGHQRTTEVLIKLPNGDLVSGSTDRLIKIWDCKTRTLKMKLEGHKHRVSSLAFIQATGYLASGSKDKTIKIWNCKNGSLVQTIETADEICALLALKNGDLASVSRENTIKIWDLKKGEVKRELIGHSKNIQAVVALPNGYIASGSKDRLIKVWDVESGTERFTLKGHSDSVLALRILPK